VKHAFIYLYFKTSLFNKLYQKHVREYYLMTNEINHSTNVIETKKLNRT